ncbi:TonB-dependent receptor plug domain-containing protein [Fibrella sp. WM1]|uniref:TonB-dependent receptor n=1 Tax=Fibrella musci TaxID=3242485 RepID=UPI003520F37D
MQISTAQPSVTISGFVREMGSDEAMPSVTVRVLNQSVGTTTNYYGFYTLTVPKALITASTALTLVYSSVGYDVVYERVDSLASQTRHVSLQSTARMLSEITVIAQQEKLSEQSQMSQVSVSMQQVRQMPVLLGEKDILKALQLLPGVQKGNEGQTGLYVRGGGPDQNLFLLDDAVIYNVSHLFGFFSIFNNDALKRVDLYKGGFPARYGGRISSVVDIQMKEGNRQQFSGEASIGPLAGRVMLEGPLLREKPSSYLISARRTFLDLLPVLGAAPSFYDLNAKANIDLTTRDKFYLSGYIGRDAFGGGGGGINWGNTAVTLRWNRLLSQKLFGTVALIASNYRFRVFTESGTGSKQVSLDYTSGIRDLTAKYDLDWHPNAAHTIRLGASVTNRRFTPNARVQRTADRDTSNLDQIKTLATEAALYIEDDIRASSWLRANIGLRAVLFNVKGRTYSYAEPRVSLALTPIANWAFKGSYARMNQFMHLLSSSGLGLPTDLWVPTTDLVAPQQGWQLTAGVAHDLPSRAITLTIEGYYKEMQNLIGYRDGASFLAVDLSATIDPTLTYNTNWEDNIVVGRGRSYGTELLLQRKEGRLTGWVGYTLSWTIHQFNAINGGREFYPRYDRRHDASIVLSYKLRPRLTLSANWVYGTGNTITLPLGTYLAGINSPSAGYTTGSLEPSGVAVVSSTLYSDRFAFRVTPYHRLDVAARFEKPTRRGRVRTWELSIYNAYNRINPFYYTTRQDRFSNESKLFRVGLFPILPSVNYSLKF